MSSSPKAGWRSRATAVWRSISSWTRWSQRIRQRQALRDQENRQFLTLQLAELEARLLLAVKQEQHRQLLSALRPLAEAMARQDSLRQSQHQETQELLLELLQASQPPLEVSSLLQESSPQQL